MSDNEGRIESVIMMERGREGEEKMRCSIWGRKSFCGGKVWEPHFVTISGHSSQKVIDKRRRRRRSGRRDKGKPRTDFWHLFTLQKKTEQRDQIIIIITVDLVYG